MNLPRKEGDRPDFDGRPSAYTALNNSHPTLYAPRTLQEIIDYAQEVYPRTIAYCERWIRHYDLRLMYEKAMLDEQEASDLIAPKPRPKQLPLLNYRDEAIRVENIWRKGEFETLKQREMTSAQYQAIYSERRGTRTVDGSHRVRIAVEYKAGHSMEYFAVFLTDSKAHPKPAPVEPEEKPLPPIPAPRPAYVPKEKTEQEKKFEAVQEALKTGITVVTAPQLFPTPPRLAARMVEEAGIEPGDRVLEPSAGTGNILEAIDALGIPCMVTAVEINRELSGMASCLATTMINGDFLECGNLGEFDRIVMNPPFKDAVDIKHILHARTMLAPGGRLVAICAGGSRQKAALEPLCDVWEPLPAGTFEESGTNVNTVLLIMEAEAHTPPPGCLF